MIRRKQVKILFMWLCLSHLTCLLDKWSGCLNVVLSTTSWICACATCRLEIPTQLIKRMDPF